MPSRDDFFNLYRHGFARVAVATPRVRIGDPRYNVDATLELMLQAARDKALLAVFPELGLSAYSCEDLFHPRALIDAAAHALAQLVARPRTLPLAALGGLRVARAREMLRERVFRGVDQCALVKKVLAAIRGKAELGEDGEQRLVARGLQHELERRVDVVAGIADAHSRRRHRDAGETMAVQVEEIVAGGHLHVILAHPGYGMLSHMLLLSEKALLGDVLLEVELNDDLRYRLRYGALVEYENGRRRVRGRSAAYEFRSVEQLRYDFERDVEAAGARLG